MDDEEPLAGAMDPVRPWTIKAISAEVRDIAIMAARKENMTVGQWLERRIREWAAADGTPGTALVGASAPAPTAPGQAHLPDPFAAAAVLVDLALKLAEAPKPEPGGKPDPLLGTARGTVRALLTSLRPEG
jgi:hypothetical protein